MIGKLFLNWALRKSETEISSYLASFSKISAWEVGKVVGMATLFHHQYTEKDPEFEVLLNSKKGENQGPISLRVMELNKLVNDMRRAGRLEDAASMKLWNITFRCMTHDTLHHYGMSLWRVASRGLPEAKQWLEARLEYAENSGHQRDAANLKKALKLYDFVPPQFRDS